MKTKCWDGQLLEIGPCLSCGFDDKDFVVGSYVSGKNGVISCEKCASGIKFCSYTDAAGQPVHMPTEGFYSVALGDRFWSSKAELSNYMKENNLVQRVDLAMGRKNHNGFKNAKR